ncbi:MAG: hypothetical protein M1151_07320 [Candidatus Thermoplasmatota archaeon]|nr:hypothetical protein [Candidatus Thermoplasmatota archaeon]MCL5786453.1 hypothetical protein [Candidatus Thermoplasmatota archaeon]
MKDKIRKELIFISAVVAILVGSAILNAALISDISSSVAQENGSIPAGAYVIHVTGSQWVWTFTYPNGTVTHDFLSVPVNTTIALIVNSTDVIHDLYIPQMDIQAYAVPGNNNTVVFRPSGTGSYFFECVEYCGEYHYKMTGTLQVVA